MAYSTTSESAQAVCAWLGWRDDIGAVETREAGGVVFVRGTALKPGERDQLRHVHMRRLTDGRLMRLTKH